jgi:hypothetical protein
VDDKELRILGDRLSELIAEGLGSRSTWALRAAIDAAQSKDVAGVLVIKIPPNTKDRLDVTFTIGVVDVISRWSA